MAIPPRQVLYCVCCDQRLAKDIGARTWRTSVSSGRVSLCSFVVVGGECGDARVWYTICQVGEQHAATDPVQIKAIWSYKMSPLPKDIEIFNEANIGAPNAPATRGGGARNKNTYTSFPPALLPQLHFPLQGFTIIIIFIIIYYRCHANYYPGCLFDPLCHITALLGEPAPLPLNAD